MSNVLIKYDPQSNAQELVRSLDDVIKVAEMAAKSRMFKDAEDMAKAAMKIMAGQELGIPPLTALRGLHVFQGKVEISAGLLAAKVKSSGKYDYRVKRSDNEACELEWFENGESLGTSSFTIEEAKKAKLASKDVWQNYASDMLFARALSRGQRRYCPDIGLGAIYTPGEISDIPEAGGTVDGEIVPGAPADAPTTVEDISRIAELEQALCDIWIEMGKDPIEFADYRNEKLKEKTAEQLESLLVTWKKAVVKKKAEVEPEEVDTESLLESIDSLFTWLNNAGVSSDDIAEIVNAMTDGKKLEHCEHGVLIAVRDRLNNFVVKQKQKEAAA